MEEVRVPSKSVAARATAVVFGILAGLGGLVHGIGEVLQGNVATENLWIYSWTQGPIATNMGGEPGITIMPTLLWAGILTIVVSTALILWSAFAVGRKHGGLLLILLSLLMLLAGGGIGPPVIGILAGVAGLAVSPRVKPHRPASALLSALWPWLYTAAVIVGTFLVVGSFALVYLIDFNHPVLFTNSFFATVVLLILVDITAPAYDRNKAG
jgi:hypothetical protein